MVEIEELPELENAEKNVIKGRIRNVWLDFD